MEIIHLITFLVMGGKIAACFKHSIERERILIQHAPYFMSIRHNGQHVCGGTLISECSLVTMMDCLMSWDLTAVSGVDGINAVESVHELRIMTETSTLGAAFAYLSNSTVDEAISQSVDIPLTDLSYDEIAHLITFRPEINELRRDEVKLAPWFRCSNNENMLCATRRSDSNMYDDEIGSPLVRYGTLIGIATGEESLNDVFDVYVDFHKYMRNPAL